MTSFEEKGNLEKQNAPALLITAELKPTAELKIMEGNES
jgi:hypothetical protein